MHLVVIISFLCQASLTTPQCTGTSCSSCELDACTAETYMSLRRSQEELVQEIDILKRQFSQLETPTTLYPCKKTKWQLTLATDRNGLLEYGNVRDTAYFAKQGAAFRIFLLESKTMLEIQEVAYVDSTNLCVMSRVQADTPPSKTLAHYIVCSTGRVEQLHVDIGGTPKSRAFKTEGTRWFVRLLTQTEGRYSRDNASAVYNIASGQDLVLCTGRDCNTTFRFTGISQAAESTVLTAHVITISVQDVANLIQFQYSASYYWNFFVSSSGYAYATRWYLDSHRYISDTDYHKRFNDSVWYSDPCWEMKYSIKQNNAGGSKKSLLLAIHQGRRIRVVINKDTKLAFEPESILITASSVHGLKAKMMLSDELNLKKADPSGKWDMHLISTDGTLVRNQCTIGEGICQYINEEFVDVSWFAETGSYAKLYETDAFGNEISGDLKELRQAATRGAVVRVQYGNSPSVLFTAAKVTLDTGNDHVYASFADLVNTEFTGGGLTFDKTATYWQLVSVSTRGTVSVGRWHLDGKPANIGHTVDEIQPTVWFVQE